MRLTVQSRLKYQFNQACEVLLLMEAARSSDQEVLNDTLAISPNAEIARLDDTVTGERRLVFTAQGEIQVAYDALVEVFPRDVGVAGLAAAPVRDLPGDALRHLRGSRYCPSDRFERFAQREFGERQGGDKVAAILDWIAEHVDYCPGVSDAATTALDTFVDRAGVCRDFAHLAITLCRASQIPARAVSAYAWKLDPPDMHAVAEVYLAGAWRLIDATCKAPIEGLVRVATGRDAADIAFMTIFGSATLISQSFAIEPAQDDSRS